MFLRGRTMFDPCLGDADRVRFANRSIPALSAGVQAMRARICSVLSCAMFARVVWLKSWRAAKLPTFAISFATRTCHAWLVRLTRARGKSSQREGNALFDDFWYFSSLKSTIKRKYLYVKDNTSSTAIAVPLLPQEKALYPLFLLQKQAQKKKLSKRKRRNEISCSAEHDRRHRRLVQAFEKA